MQITILTVDQSARYLPRLADLLLACVADGAVVGHILPLERETALSYRRSVSAAAAAGERLLLAAFDGDTLAGTVQLYLSPEANAPHRGEVFKLLVDRHHRQRGIGANLMLEVERQARARGRSLLLLDTVEDGAGDRLY